MKLSKIFGIVLSLHVGVILLVMFQPGCQTGGPKKKPVEPSEENVSVENEFNEGVIQVNQRKLRGHRHLLSPLDHLLEN